MLLSVHDLSFAYPSEPCLFKNVSFTMGEGQVLTILGPNGVGKTTLLNCLAGLSKPDAGEILLQDKPLSRLSFGEIARRLAYVPQTIIPSFDYLVIEYVVAASAPYLKTFERPKAEHYLQAEQALRRLDILHLADKSYRNLSGGERQQVCIARAIMQRSKLILMDEPTAHLDYGNQIKILKIIRELAQEGYCVICTTHNPDHCLLLQSQVALLDDHAAFSFGTHTEIISQQTLQSLYDADIRLTALEDNGRKLCYVRQL
ncbi:MAG: ABC transporter ATP-binding protein [Clostridia bacterium]|nr:ABC transporter ATP-binding protein [Clostridia bacterium]